MSENILKDIPKHNYQEPALSIDKEEFINIIESTLTNYRELIHRYREYFNCDLHKLETFNKNNLTLRGIAVVSDTNEKDMHFQ